MNFPIFARIVDKSGVIGQSFGEGLRQFAGRGHIPKEDVGDSVATFLTRIPGLYDPAHFIQPVHRDRRTCVQDDDRIFIYDSLSEDLIALPEHSVWERNRRIPMAIWGVFLGALAGFGSAYLRSFADPYIPQDLVVMVTVVGAILGGLMFHVAAGNEHEKRLQEFQDSIYQRGLMLVTDVPRQNYRKIHQLAAR